MLVHQRVNHEQTLDVGATVSSPLPTVRITSRIHRIPLNMFLLNLLHQPCKMDSFIEAGGPLIIPLIIKSQQTQLLGIEETHFLKPRSYIDNIILYPSDMAHKLLRYIYIIYIYIP